MKPVLAFVALQIGATPLTIDAQTHAADVADAPNGGAITTEAVATRKLGEAYAEGTNGLPKDPEKAVALWRSAAATGDFTAEFDLARALLTGNGAAVDENNGRRLLISAAKAGVLGAEVVLGRNLLHGSYGFDKNESAGLTWIRKAAQQEYPAGERELGTAYYNGDGVEKNEAEANLLYGLAAQQGDSRAQSYVGDAYFYGDGVEKDEQEALKWYKKAAKQNDPWAFDSLGDFYELADSVRPDFALAAKYYGLSATHDYPIAQFELGKLYRDGKGVPKDLERAYQLINRAAKNGDDSVRQDAIVALYAILPSVSASVIENDPPAPENIGETFVRLRRKYLGWAIGVAILLWLLVGSLTPIVRHLITTMKNTATSFGGSINAILSKTREFVDVKYLLWLIPASLMVMALERHKYEFYVALRTLVLIFGALIIYATNRPIGRWVILSLPIFCIMILFNPVKPLHFSRETWAYFNVASAVVLIGHLFVANLKWPKLGYRGGVTFR